MAIKFEKRASKQDATSGVQFTNPAEEFAKQAAATAAEEQGNLDAFRNEWSGNNKTNFVAPEGFEYTDTPDRLLAQLKALGYDDEQAGNLLANVGKYQDVVPALQGMVRRSATGEAPEPETSYSPEYADVANVQERSVDAALAGVGAIADRLAAREVADATPSSGISSGYPTVTEGSSGYVAPAPKQAYGAEGTFLRDVNELGFTNAMRKRMSIYNR